MRWASLLFVLAALTSCARPRMMDEDASALSVPPVSRLGRWDGTHFVAVEPGSIPPSTLRVLVHGWTPGWDAEAIDEDHPRAWELTGPSGEHFEPWMPDLARMIVGHDPHAVVLAFSWADASSTDRHARAHRRALVHTTAFGHVLAGAIETALAEDFYASNGRIQLIGHSYGARVAAVAAVAMSTPPAQLTLFDAPDGVMVEIAGTDAELPELLGRLPIGWGSGHTFVDNYVSMIGRRYGWRDGLGSVRDVALAPPFGSLSYRRRHLYPMAFYVSSPGHGFGYDWSPLTGRASAPQMGCYEQRVAGEESLVLGCNGNP